MYYLWISFLLLCMSSYRLLGSSLRIELYGSEQTRSPLVNWFLLEKDIPFSQKPPRPSNHPFGQVPFLTSSSDDQAKAEIFESGAILIYLADEFGATLKQSQSSNAIERAKYAKWVVWANAELDSICFKTNPPALDRQNRALDRLENILSDREWIVDNNFSVADVAIASYLNYVPVFFRLPSDPLTSIVRPNIASYMQRAAQRPKFLEAFGKDHVNIVLQKTNAWIRCKK